MVVHEEVLLSSWKTCLRGSLVNGLAALTIKGIYYHADKCITNTPFIWFFSCTTEFTATHYC